MCVARLCNVRIAHSEGKNGEREKKSKQSVKIARVGEGGAYKVFRVWHCAIPTNDSILRGAIKKRKLQKGGQGFFCELRVLFRKKELDHWKWF